jgi:hypothetical protein
MNDIMYGMILPLPLRRGTRRRRPNPRAADEPAQAADEPEEEAADEPGEESGSEFFTSSSFHCGNHSSSAFLSLSGRVVLGPALEEGVLQDIVACAAAWSPGFCGVGGDVRLVNLAVVQAWTSTCTALLYISGKFSL